MSEAANDEIVQILNSSKTNDEARDAISDYVKKLREGGQEKDVILARLQELRSSVSHEQEDILLEVMDFLTGFCHPDAKIK